MMSQQHRRGGGRGGPRQHAAGPSQQPAAVTPASLLQEAEALQQRAERRGGQEAVVGFEAAAAKYRAALQAGVGPDALPDASFGLAECLQSWADLRRELQRQAPNEQLGSQQQEQQVQQAAAEAYRASLQAYQQVPAAAGSAALRSDAAVNAANVLCSLAELSTGAEAGQLLQQAVGLYQAALQQEREDADTLSNLADAQVALGEAALQAGQAEAGQAAFAAALEAYLASCTLCDSAHGDDLPGLLHNWGVGLHTVSKHAQEQQLKQLLLDQAAAKLRHSIQFSRADPAPHNALGDVLVDAAELIVSSSDGTSGPAEPAAQPHGASLPAAAAAAAAALLKAATDEGFMAALTISRHNADALVGLAEVAVATAKLAWRQGDAAAAASHINAAVGHYASALQRPHLLGTRSDRADVRYNAACASALAGQAHTCQALLQGLAVAGVLKAADLAGDSDFAAVRAEPWFVQLLHQLQQA